MQSYARFGVSLALALLVVSPAFAKPRTKTFPQNCTAVWAAVKTAVSTQHYNFADMDDAQKKGIVSTGNNWSGKRYLDITLTAPDANSCVVAIGGSFSGLAHDDKGDLFARINDALVNPQSKPAADATQPSPPQK